jgi:AraC-like DNA-binding protein
VGRGEHAALSSIPATHVLQLVDVVARWGVTAEELFAGLDLELRRLEEPSARVPLALVERLAVRARELTGEHCLGIHLGMQMRLSAHGYLGFAAMSASTLREALDLALRFAPTQTTAIGLRLHESANMCALVIEENVPLGDARDLLILGLGLGIERIATALTGSEIEGTADVTFSAPKGIERFPRFADQKWLRFDQPINQLVFAESVLDRPILRADPIALRLAQEQCERELAALGRPTDITAQVRSLVVKPGGGFHSLGEVANLLHVSPRTLKRRLAELETGFSELLEEQQREQAFMLLRSSDLSLEEVAEQVGYSDVANFARAFRRWTGTTPGAFRRSAKPARKE